MPEFSPAAPAENTPRPTIGLLIARLGRVWGAEFMQGIVDAVQAEDVNLLCFVGGKCDTENPDHLCIYDLACPENLDGLILSPDLGYTASTGIIEQLHQRLAKLPIVAVSLDLQDVPIITSDDYNGMRQAVEHLIQEHQCKRIAFIQGPSGQLEAEARYQAYLDTLHAHHIPFDQNLVAPGDFTAESGQEAVRILLDERGVDFQALLTANDRMAFGAYQALRVGGRDVPADVALIGFDDVMEAQVMNVPLTTVRQQFYTSGQRAVESLVGMLRGKQPPAREVLPTELVLRSSCGCLPLALRQVANEESASFVQTPKAVAFADQLGVLHARKPVILTSLQKIFFETVPSASAEARIQFVDTLHTYWDLFLSDLSGQSHQLFPKRILTDLSVPDGFVNPGQDSRLWHCLLSDFRHQVLPALSDRQLSLRAENLLEQVRILIGESAQRDQALERLAVERQEQKLQKLGHSLASMISLSQLYDALDEHLPNLGMDHCHVALYQPAEPGSPADITRLQARLLLKYDRGLVDCSKGELNFPARQLAPQKCWPADRRFSAIINELTFSQSQMGFLWTEIGSLEWEIHTRLAYLLSSGLFRVLLIKEREDAMQEVGKLLVSSEQHSMELASANAAAEKAAQGLRLALQETESLFEAARSILGATEIKSICDKLSQYITKLVGAEHISIYLLDQEQQEVTLSLVDRQFDSPAALDYLHLDSGPSHIVLRTGMPVLSVDADDGTESPESAARRRQDGVGPVLAAPLSVKDQVIGLVIAQNSLGGPAFIQHDMDLLLSLATQATAALENASLYSKITQFNEQLEEMVIQRTEELNRAYRTLEKLDQNKTDFIDVAAHELRTPLTVIKGYMDMLAGDSSVQTKAYLLSIVEGLQKGTDRLQLIVNRMLDLARIDSQLLDMHVEVTSLPAIIRRAESDYAAASAARQLSIHLQGLEDLPYIKADPQLLLKVYQNLIGNAVKYTPDGGQITISGRLVNDLQLGVCVETSVADTGIGIDPEYQELIFEKFYQTGAVALHSSGDTKFMGGGTGLGLSIVRGIVQAHGGRIWVESLGHDEQTYPGSIFHILLPVG